MASNVVRATLLADAQRFKAGFREAEKATAGFDTKMSSTASMAKGLLAGAAATAVVAFAKDSVRAFSDLEQSTGSVESVFGSASDSIIKQSKAAADAYGLSAADFNQSSALIGAQLKNVLGLSVDEAALKTQDLIGRASDLAATFGGTTSDAISAIGSLLRGERDPIEKYGASMNEAMIQAKALEMGLADAGGELTTQAKGVAALEILYDQTADSAGQFAREADTLAGSQQRLNAQLENNKALVGQALAPAWGAATDLFGEAAKVVGNLGLHISLLTGDISRVEKETQEWMLKSGEMITTGEQLIEVWQRGGTDLGELTNFVQLNRDELVKLTEKTDDYYEALGLTDEETVQYREHLGTLITDLDRGRGREQEYAAALMDKKAAQEGVNQATQTQIDLLRAAADPIFNASQKIQALKDAEKRLLEVQGDVNASTEDLAAAELDVVEALFDAQGAMDALTPDQLNAAIASIQTATGKSKDEVIELLRQLGILDGTTVTTYIDTVHRNWRGRQGGPQEFHSGGVVPGHPGEEVPIIAMAGETILPTHRGGRKPQAVRATGGTVINITVNALDPQGAAKAVVQAIEIYKRNNGGRLPF